MIDYSSRTIRISKSMETFPPHKSVNDFVHGAKWESMVSVAAGYHIAVIHNCTSASDVWSCLWAVSLLCLLGATYRLWIPQQALPQLPLFGFAGRVSDSVQWGMIGVLVGSLIVLVISRRPRRWVWWIVCGCLVGCFWADQHRLQPWAYQGAIYALLFALTPPGKTQRWIVPVAISIYAFSGLRKLDYQSAHSVGQQMIDAMAKPLGGLPEAISTTHRIRIALMLPAAE